MCEIHIKEKRENEGTLLKTTNNTNYVKKGTQAI